MECGLVCSILDGIRNRRGKCSVQLSANGGKEAISDKYDTQVEASIKAKGQLYCYLSVTWLLPEVVGPAHLETICSQKGIGQQEAMFYRLVYTYVCNSTGS